MGLVGAAVGLHAAPHHPALRVLAHRCSDPSKLEALNLNPGVPRVDEQTRREFEQFKAQQAASKGCAWAGWASGLLGCAVPSSCSL